MRRVGTILALLLAAAAPAGAGAQVTATSPLQVALDRQKEYEEATKASEAAELKVERLRHEWNQLLERHARAVQDGDRVRGGRLLAELQERSGPKNLAENEWRKHQEEWIAAGKALRGAIDANLQVLWEQIERSVGSLDDDALNQYREWAERLDRLEEELPREPLELEPMPEVRIRRGDTPREIEYKARVIENRIDNYEELLEELDMDIEALERRLRREQSRRDFLGGRERFGDLSVPSGYHRSDPETRAVEGDPKPIEVRIGEKQAFKEEVENRMRELKQKAADFRKRAGGTT